MDKIVESVQRAFARNFTVSALKVIIVLWAFFVIALALSVDDEWILAGLLAYEVLP